MKMGVQINRAPDFPFANRVASPLNRAMRNLDNQLNRTRTSLIERLKNWQDQASWQAFFDIYSKLIFNFALKSGLTVIEADDVVQETLISVAKHMPSFKYDRKIGSFKAWLLNMTRWRITDQYRQRPIVRHSHSNSGNNASATTAGILDGIADPRTLDMEAYWETEWTKTLIEAAIGKLRRSLNPKHYQVFDLAVNKEWPLRRIAKTHRITVEQVYMRKHRVAQAIKEEVERLQEAIT
jgi:RNA polymerase sigma factor (sigma-70 family)